MPYALIVSHFHRTLNFQFEERLFMSWCVALEYPNNTTNQIRFSVVGPDSDISIYFYTWSIQLEISYITIPARGTARTVLSKGFSNISIVLHTSSAHHG